MKRIEWCRCCSKPIEWDDGLPEADGIVYLHKMKEIIICSDCSQKFKDMVDCYFKKVKKTGNK